ncbi:MAG TPA: hypothetical protein VMW72_24425 [Sedimentisphaerales bacterium]|nr:hypothetical protein [Sedimentisphaerales bacterium]
MTELSTTERNIIKALGNETLKLEHLAAKAGYRVSGNFRRTVSSFSKRGILGNKNPGYFVQPQYQRIIDKPSTWSVEKAHVIKKDYRFAVRDIHVCSSSFV